MQQTGVARAVNSSETRSEPMDSLCTMEVKYHLDELLAAQARLV
jgi:hypothetical protein